MQTHIFDLLKIAAKKSFQKLRIESPFFSKELNSEIKVTKLFFDHIAFHKRRKTKELTERLILIPLVEEIIKHGKKVEIREDKENIYFRLAHQIKNHQCFAVILKTPKQYLLFSCFIKNKK